ncbi:MAG: hypothetical protein ACREEA_09290 [Stellaceae bacterium]
MLRSVEEIGGTRIRLDERLAIRAVALVHDVTHIWFGHTIEDELGFYPRHDEDGERYQRLLFFTGSILGPLLNTASFGRAIS